MTSKGYSNDIKVQCSSWVVAVIMGVCLYDPAKVGLSLSLSPAHTHTHTITLAPSPDDITLWEEREVRVPGGVRGEKETAMRKRRGTGGERGGDC